MTNAMASFQSLDTEDDSVLRRALQAAASQDDLMSLTLAQLSGMEPRIPRISGVEATASSAPGPV